MDSLPFPQPITYISKIEINSTDKNASGFYDQLNQEQYDSLLRFKELLTKDNIIKDFVTYDELYLLRFLRARKFNLEKTMLMLKICSNGEKKSTLMNSEKVIPLQRCLM